MRQLAADDQTGPSRTSGDGWGWFVVSVLAQSYLVFLATLLLISLIPLIVGWQSYLVTSGSMEPSISAGDVAIASDYNPEDVVPVGGVVAFHMSGDASAVTLHRIVDAHDDGTLVTAGDANAQVDTTPLEREDIIAVGRVLVPFVGLPALWLTSGQFVPFTTWALLTGFAIFAVVFVHRPRRGDEDGGDHDQAAQADYGIAQTAAGAPAVGGVSRRVLLAAAVGMVALGAAGIPRGQANAAFTGVSVNQRNAWSVATLPALSLGRMSPYALFAATSVSNAAFLGIGTSVTGSVGTSPGNQVVDFWPWDISGSVDRDNAVARNARIDGHALVDAITARPTTRVLSPTLNGSVSPGVYESSSGAFTISGTLVLDAGGDPSAVFIFRGQTLRAAANSRVQLLNGASADRVFWSAPASVTLDQGSATQGNLLTNGAASMGRSSTLVGRLISLGGAVTVTRADVRLPS